MCLSPIPKLEAHQTQRLLQVIDHVHKRQKPTAVLKSLDLGAVLAISANNTEKPAEPDRDQDDEDPGVESGEYTGRTSARLTVYPGLSMRIICFKLQLSTMFWRLVWMNCSRYSLLSKVTRTFSCVPMYD